MDSASTISAALDLHTKLKIFDDTTQKQAAIDAIRQHFDSYQPLSSHNNADASENETMSTCQFFWQLTTASNQETSIDNSDSNQLPSNSNSNELDNYLQSLPNEKMEPLAWWKAHQQEYPVLSLLAQDYLPIQATSVACEQAFSVAGHTISRTRNRLHPETARACLCLKSWMRNRIGE